MDSEQENNPYSDKVIDHASRPRNMGMIAEPDGYASTLGSCGDNMEMWVKVTGGRIQEATFWTDGCGATRACGSIATEMAKGKSPGEALTISSQVIFDALDGLPEDHVHCAGLASTALKKAILDQMAMEKEPWKKAYRKH